MFSDAKQFVYVLREYIHNTWEFFVQHNLILFQQIKKLRFFLKIFVENSLFNNKITICIERLKHKKTNFIVQIFITTNGKNATKNLVITLLRR